MVGTRHSAEQTQALKQTKKQQETTETTCNDYSGSHTVGKIATSKRKERGERHRLFARVAQAILITLLLPSPKVWKFEKCQTLSRRKTESENHRTTTCVLTLQKTGSPCPEYRCRAIDPCSEQRRPLLACPRPSEFGSKIEKS